MDIGPSLWKYMHRLALKNEYPSDVIKIFELLGDVIPCEVCQTHYKSYMDENKIESDSLFMWTIKLHNSVNEKLGKYSKYDERDAMIAHDKPCTHDFIQVILPYLKQNNELFDLFLKTYPCPECSLVEPEPVINTVKLCLDCENK